MKKLLFCLMVLFCGVMVPSIQASSSSTSGPTCPANAPCLYNGPATCGGTTLQITVHRLNDYTTDLVAKFSVKTTGEIETAYVFPSGLGDGRWYFNWNGCKYWFEM